MKTVIFRNRNLTFKVYITTTIVIINCVDLQYDEIPLILTAGSVCSCHVYNHVAILGLSVKLSWYPMRRCDDCGACTACVYAEIVSGCESDGKMVCVPEEV